MWQLNRPAARRKRAAFFFAVAALLHIKIDMASTVEQLLNPETLLATPVDVLQPFAAKDSYFVPKLVTSPV